MASPPTPEMATFGRAPEFRRAPTLLSHGSRRSRTRTGSRGRASHGTAPSSSRWTKSVRFATCGSGCGASPDSRTHRMHSGQPEWRSFRAHAGAPRGYERTQLRPYLPDGNWSHANTSRRAAKAGNSPPHAGRERQESQRDCARRRLERWRSVTTGPAVPFANFSRALSQAIQSG